MSFNVDHSESSQNQEENQEEEIKKKNWEKYERSLVLFSAYILHPLLLSLEVATPESK